MSLDTDDFPYGPFILLIVFSVMFIYVCVLISHGGYDECMKKTCPPGFSPSYVLKPTRCVCEIPAK